MVTLRWLVSAKEDLRNIYDFIAEGSERYASHQIEQIREATSVLNLYPKAGKKVHEYDDETIREIVISHYRIIYRIISPTLIHIILIHHGARKFPRIVKL